MNTNKKNMRKEVKEIVEKYQAPGYVYFVTTGSYYIKAGYTTSPKRRIATYNTDNPMLKFYTMIPVENNKAERWCQKQLLEAGCKRSKNEMTSVEWYVMPTAWRNNKNVVHDIVKMIVEKYYKEYE